MAGCAKECKVNDIEVDPFSIAIVKLTMMRDDNELAIGTGSIWEMNDSKFLVTAWHCLTGTNPETGQSISSSGARPNLVYVHLKTKSVGCEFRIPVPLYHSDGSPSWIVHKLGYRELDIAAINIPPNYPSDVISYCANKICFFDHQINVGQDLFILGFPKNVHRIGLPIWKRASLAIDPQAVFDAPGMRHLIVDTAGREGMSGGLAIIRSSGGVIHQDSSIIFGTKHATKIVGLYTGRISASDALAAQLGIVIPKQYIDEMLEEGVSDTFSI